MLPGIHVTDIFINVLRHVCMNLYNPQSNRKSIGDLETLIESDNTSHSTSISFLYEPSFDTQGEGSQVEWVGLQRLWIQIQRKEYGRVHRKKVAPMLYGSE